MVEVSGSKLAGVNFEDLAEALDKDPDFRDAVIQHLGGAGRVAKVAAGNHVNIETRANFSLDDSKIFDLNGEGLRVTVVAVN